MLHRIIAARARPNFTVEISWDDGSTSSIGFAGIVGRGVAAPLGDFTIFAKIAAADEGYALAWPDDIEFSADSLWYKAHPDDAKRDIEAAE
jgi:hypothetical protein